MGSGLHEHRRIILLHSGSTDLLRLVELRHTRHSCMVLALLILVLVQLGVVLRDPVVVLNTGGVPTFLDDGVVRLHIN